MAAEPWWWVLVVTLTARGAVEVCGVVSENAYHTAAPWRAALSGGACAAIGIPVSRLVIADGSDVGALAVVLVVGAGSWFGCRNLSKRKAGKP